MTLPVFATEIQAQKAQSLKNLKEFHERKGLPNFFQKAKTSRQVRIAYFGGSITAAESGWRELSFDWLRLKFPQTAFYQINAAIGGTGSNLGVFRMERDVLNGKPDLIFVEFAVNDAAQPREKILKSMEGIIRKCWSVYPNTDICFVYTAVEEHIKNLVSGKLHPSVLAMEELADYYGIPSIHMALEVARLYSQNKLILSGDPKDNDKTIVFTRDHTHPLSESGHPLYGYIVAKYLDKMKNRSKSVSHQLPAPFTVDNWEKAKMVNLSDAEKNGSWEKLTPQDDLSQKFSKFMPVIYKATPGSSIRFTFSGKVFGLYDIIGPGTGLINVAIDGKERKVNRFDPYSTSYRLGMTMLAENLEDGPHTVEIKVLDGGVNKKEIILKERLSEMLAHPEDYTRTDWYLGNVLVLDK